MAIGGVVIGLGGNWRTQAQAAFGAQNRVHAAETVAGIGDLQRTCHTAAEATWLAPGFFRPVAVAAQTAACDAGGWIAGLIEGVLWGGETLGVAAAKVATGDVREALAAGEAASDALWAGAAIVGGVAGLRGIGTPRPIGRGALPVGEPAFATAAGMRPIGWNEMRMAAEEGAGGRVGRGGGKRPEGATDIRRPAHAPKPRDVERVERAEALASSLDKKKLVPVQEFKKLVTDMEEHYFDVGSAYSKLRNRLPAEWRERLDRAYQRATGRTYGGTGPGEAYVLARRATRNNGRFVKADLLAERAASRKNPMSAGQFEKEVLGSQCDDPAAVRRMYDTWRRTLPENGRVRLDRAFTKVVGRPYSE